jgi:tetratricopeptide (TPR) repeat protein
MRFRLAAVVAIAAAALLYGQSAQDREAAYRSNNVGVALLEQFDYEGAAASFREALKRHPGLDVARLNLAIALFYAGKTGDAAVEARAAAERLPSAPQAHYISGLIARSEDNADAAAAAFERVRAIDPSDAGTKVNLGQLALQQRQYDRALALFREALAAEPFNVTAAYSAALALTRSGKPEEGRKAMQQFEALRDSAYGVTYSQTYLGQGKYAEAIASTGAEAELVNPAVPAVTFTDATDTVLPAGRAAAAVTRGGVTLFDADGDGDLDLFAVSGMDHRFLRNDRGVFTNDTVRAGLAGGDEGIRTGAIAGDYDNDGRVDLFLLRPGGHALYRQNEAGAFVNVTRSAFERIPHADAAAAFADTDHDGDLDILLAGKPTQLLRNNGNGTFADIATQAGVSAPVGAVAAVATDYDNRRDIDLLILPAAAAPVLYRNLRDGSFRNAAAEAGLPADGAFSALAAGDVNKDGFTDFFLGRPAQAATLALSDGQLRFRSVAAPEETRGARAAQFTDYDNDGLLDLLAADERRARLFRNLGDGRWSDVSGAARLPAFPAGRGPSSLALGDLDGDGDTDAVFRLADGELRIWKNEGGNRNASLRVQLSARVSNRSAAGARVEIRAGSLRQQIERSVSSPATGPADLIFGLGPRPAADVVRVLWPSGILQAETGSAPIKPGTLAVTELDRKPSSCPYLFTWNGERFEFVTDFMGGSEMGAWVGAGAWNAPDPDEYVRLGRGQLQARNGRFELRVTNELEEALFIDRLQLVAVDHPAGIEVFPNEGLRSPPRPPLAVTAARGARPPLRARDEHGHDVLPQISALDRRYPDDFGVLPIRGYAEPHFLTLDLGPADGRPTGDVVLLLTGWTDYAFSSDNVAAAQRGATMAPPSVQVKDASGAWRTVVREIGFPVGRPQTIPVTLRGEWLSASREVRIATSMRIYWDRILVAQPDAAVPRTTRLDAAVADLRWRGFSAEISPDGREPFAYDYERVSSKSPWKVMTGRYTREGDVRPLLQAVDDMYVISRPGDELAVAFDERALPPLTRGWERTLLVYAYGWSKEMNPRSASPDSLRPLPFFRMSGYPYGPGEAYPRTELHRTYHEKYNTRVVRRSIGSIDAMLR